MGYYPKAKEQIFVLKEDEDVDSLPPKLPPATLVVKVVEVPKTS